MSHRLRGAPVGYGIRPLFGKGMRVLPTRWQSVACCVLVLATGGCARQDPTEPANDGRLTPIPGSITVVEGEDYSLPAGAACEDFSGYVDHPTVTTADGGMPQRNWWTTWAELEPQRGQYDWAPVDAKLAAAAAGGYAVSLQLQSIVCGGGDPDRGITIPCAVPEWVFTEFRLEDDDRVPLGGEFGIEVIPGWREDIRTAFEEFIRAFGAAGYPQRPELGSAYVHAISPSRGEEFWLNNTALMVLESRDDYSPTILQGWLADRIATYASAFAGVEHKLAWVGMLGAWRYYGGDYPDVALSLLHTAWDLGLGNRSSAVERYHLWLDEPALGLSLDDDGYIHVDETIPPIAGQRYFGDENEEYGDAWTWMHGDRAHEPLRYRLALLRALQTRLRFLWTSEAAETVNPPLSHYVRMSLGKTVTTSPDAWAYLKETPVNDFFTPAGVVRNFERWLVQRDVPGGLTAPAERTEHDYDAGYSPPDLVPPCFDYLARRTDLATGNTFIGFDLDDRFVVSGPVEIKVEIRDTAECTWHVTYVDADGVVTTTPSYPNVGDQKVWTVTFAIDDARFAGGLAWGQDFRIVSEGPGDVTVRWVRVVR